MDGAEDLRALDPDVALFSESGGRLLITVAPERAEAVERRLSGLFCLRAGRVTAEPRLHVRCGERSWIDLPAGELRVAFKETLADA